MRTVKKREIAKKTGGASPPCPPFIAQQKAPFRAVSTRIEDATELLAILPGMGGDRRIAQYYTKSITDR